MISVFLDTNVLYSRSEDFTKVQFVEMLEKVIEEIEVNDIYTEVKLIIPQIVISELYEQQLENYQRRREEFEKIKFPYIKIEKEIEYADYLTELFQKEQRNFEKRDITIEFPPFPSDSKMPDIIHRAIEKNPPFEGKDGKSDKGFKDVLVWETLKEYKEKHITDIIVIYSGDRMLTHANELKREYRQEFNDLLYTVSKNRDDLIKILSMILDKKLENSFGVQLENRLKMFLSENNDVFKRFMLADSIFSDGIEIMDFRVKGFDILFCSDKEENVVKYEVELRLQLFYNDNVQIEEYRRFSDNTFIFLYNFEEDEFYLLEYDALNFGRVEFNHPENISLLTEYF